MINPRPASPTYVKHVRYTLTVPGDAILVRYSFYRCALTFQPKSPFRLPLSIRIIASPFAISGPSIKMKSDLSVSMTHLKPQLLTRRFFFVIAAPSRFPLIFPLSPRAFPCGFIAWSAIVILWRLFKVKCYIKRQPALYVRCSRQPRKGRRTTGEARGARGAVTVRSLWIRVNPATAMMPNSETPNGYFCVVTSILV